MKPLKENYRELLKNWNFSKENRLIFAAPEAQPEPVAQPDAIEEKPKKSLSADDAPKIAGKKVEQAEEEGDKVVKLDEASTDELEAGGPGGEPKKPAVKTKTATAKEVAQNEEGIGKPEDAEKAKEAKKAKEGSKEAEAKEAEKQDAEKNKLFANPTAFKSLVSHLNKMPAMTRVKLKLDPKNEDMAKMAKLILSKVDITRLKSALKGKLEPTEKERVEMKKAVLKNIGTLIDKSEVAEKKEISTLSEWADELRLSFLEDSEPLKNLIALRFKIEKVGDDNKTILINGTKKVTSKEQLIALVTIKEPALGQQLTGYTEAVENNADNTDDLLKKLVKHADDKVKTHEAMKKLVEAFSDPEKAGKMGLLESLGALLQLWGAIKTAMDSGDWQTLNEMFVDFNKGENPAKSMEKSKEQYKNVLVEKKIDDPKLLINAYLSPRGKEADALFTEGLPDTETEEGEKKFSKEALSKYRMEAKPAIQTYLADKLSVNSIDSITKLPNGFIDIVAYDTNSGDKISIEIKLGAKISARKIAYEEKPPAKKGGKTTMGKVKMEGGWTENIKNLKELDDKVIIGKKVAVKPEDKSKEVDEKVPEQIQKEIAAIQEKILKEVGEGVGVEIEYDKERNGYGINVTKEKGILTSVFVLRDEKNVITDDNLQFIKNAALRSLKKNTEEKKPKLETKEGAKNPTKAVVIEKKTEEPKAKEVDYKDSDVDSRDKRIAILKDADLLGSGKEFQNKWEVAKDEAEKVGSNFTLMRNGKRKFNAPEWEKDWIKKNVKKTEEGTA